MADRKPAPTQISCPSDENPRQLVVEVDGRLILGMACTDCTPECIVDVHDVSHWESTSGEQQEKEAIELAKDGMRDWLIHMQEIHGLVPNWEEPK